MIWLFGAARGSTAWLERDVSPFLAAHHPPNCQDQFAEASTIRRNPRGVIVVSRGETRQRSVVMGILARIFGSKEIAPAAKTERRAAASKTRTASAKTAKTSATEKESGAGPALAAHSKDAKSTKKSGQNAKAAAKKH